MTASTTGSASTRQPDYRISANGIPQLVSSRRPVTRYQQRTSTNGMDHQRNGNAPATDPVKLNKCLYNLAVRNGTVGRGQTNGGGVGGGNNSSKIESDIAIRAQYSNNNNNKSQPSTNGSSSPAAGTLLSVSAATGSSARLGNWRSSIASSMAASANCDVRGGDDSRRNSLASIPRSRNCSFTSAVATRTDQSRPSIFASGRRPEVSNVNCGGDGGSTTLLNARRPPPPPRRNAVEAIGLSHHRGGDESGSGGGAVTRQCRFSAVVQKPPTAPDNRLNYQRKYDRTIFGYNRLDQFVLPPLQI